MSEKNNMPFEFLMHLNLRPMIYKNDAYFGMQHNVISTSAFGIVKQLCRNL